MALFLIRIATYPWLPPQNGNPPHNGGSDRVGDELIAMGYRVENREDDGTEELDKWLNQ